MPRRNRPSRRDRAALVVEVDDRPDTTEEMARLLVRRHLCSPLILDHYSVMSLMRSNYRRNTP